MWQEPNPSSITSLITSWCYKFFVLSIFVIVYREFCDLTLLFLIHFDSFVINYFFLYSTYVVLLCFSALISVIDSFIISRHRWRCFYSLCRLFRFFDFYFDSRRPLVSVSYRFWCHRSSGGGGSQGMSIGNCSAQAPKWPKRGDSFEGVVQVWQLYIWLSIMKH